MTGNIHIQKRLPNIFSYNDWENTVEKSNQINTDITMNGSVQSTEIGSDRLASDPPL